MLALPCPAAGMTKRQRLVLKVKPEYGYCHPSCQVSPPPGVPRDQVSTQA